MSWIFFVLRNVGDMVTAYPDSLNNFSFLLSLPSNTGAKYPFFRKFSLLTLAYTDFSLSDHITIALNPSMVPIVQRCSSDSITQFTWPFRPGQDLPLNPTNQPYQKCYCLHTTPSFPSYPPIFHAFAQTAPSLWKAILPTSH